MIEFGKILYSNKTILKFKGVNIFFIFILFFLNTALIISPLFMNRANIDAEELLGRFDGLEEAFAELYDSNLDCDITEYARCGLPESANGYEIVIEGEPTTDKFIWFTDVLAIQERPEETALVGTYDFLEGYTFNPTDYKANTEGIVYAMSASTVGRDYFVMYTGQFIQNAIYLMAIAAMMMIANYRQAKRKITYTEAVKVSVMAMLGPALIAAVAGTVFAAFATLIFMAVYAIRMMYVYYGILKS